VSDLELIEQWRERLRLKEGLETCTFALGMAIGSFLEECREDEVDASTAHCIANLFSQMKQELETSGADTTSLEGLWEVFLEVTAFKGPSHWDFLFSED